MGFKRFEPGPRRCVRGFLAVTAVMSIAGATIAAAASGPAPSSPGRRVISAAVRPFVDTWAQMALRSARTAAARRAAGTTGGPNVFLRFPLEPEAPERGHRGRRDPGAYVPPSAPTAQTLGQNFPAGSMEDEVLNFRYAFIPPDTMGAIGPSHFVEVINGLVIVFSRTGMRVGEVDSDSFFSLAQQGVAYPRSGAYDPRVQYDRHSRRWFASALEFSDFENNQVILAVSRTSDPTGAWDKYVIPVGEPAADVHQFFSDFDTLGVDDNGVYVGVNIFAFNTDTNQYDAVFARVTAIPKSSLLAASPYLASATLFDNGGTFAPHPASNLDPGSPSSPAWIVSSDGQFAGVVHCQPLTWSGGAPALGPDTVLPTNDYDYAPLAASEGATTGIDTGDDRPISATIRGQHLWMARNAGVNASGTVNFISDTRSDADRSACEWFEVDVSGSTPTVLQTGRVWDPSDQDPTSYFYPSIVVNGQGHAVMGFSGAADNTFVSSFYCGRLAADAPGTMGAVTQINPGEDSYTQLDDNGLNRWGDYSATTLDPNDDQTIWTVQEYGKHIRFDSAPSIGTSRWGTWAAQLVAPAPTVAVTPASAVPGQRGITLPITGTGFFDPGGGFPDRLSVQLVGGAENGISRLAVSYYGPTSLSLTFDLALNASPGPRDLIVTNPDGQTVVAPGAVTVAATPTGKLKVATRLGFGAVRRGRTSTRSLQITNTSSTDTLVVNIGPASGPFLQITGGASLVIGPGENRIIELVFQPTRLGHASGALSMTSSDPALPSVTVHLSGSGV